MSLRDAIDNILGQGSGRVTEKASRWGGVRVNDMHSQLNATHVREIERPNTLSDLQEIVWRARAEGLAVCIAGARHAMGGQQFAADALLVDMSRLKRVLYFDCEKGQVEVEAGILWVDLVQHLVHVQQNQESQWGILQKQTGADQLSLGGSLAANVHGRGLYLKPIIQDIESFLLVDAEGEVRLCSREENPELFRLVIGGYGLFGIVYSLTLRLTPRQKVERVVQILSLRELMPAFEHRIRDGFLYGDFQYMTDENSVDFLFKGVFSCYRPVPQDTPIRASQKQISLREWDSLVHLAHTDKARAYKLYADYYLSSSGQIYWSDTHQLGAYIEDYHRRLDRKMQAVAPATEMITELFVPRDALSAFLRDVREDFRQHDVNVVYGTIRLVEKDDESFLAWAKEAYAGIIFNLHVAHTPPGIAHAQQAFRRLIDRAIQHRGSFYLTYHKFATRDQLLVCYPQFPQFLQEKRRYDPEERFQSDWYRHYRRLVEED
jgi:FAD/FMN-containing dehydrogenase